MRRRNFINGLGAGATLSLVTPTLLSFTPSIGAKKIGKSLNFGIVSDVHKDLIPDADQRLESFIHKAIDKEVDFIIQMGDFCFGEEKNRGFLNIWNQFKGAKYHVLGNHDMDKNSKEEMLDFWGMPKTYYSYDVGGYHFIVLDANFLYQDGKFIDYKHANFYVDDSIRTFIDNEQIEWFKADLRATKLPTIVFSHQSLWHYQWGVKNRLTLQKIMETYNDKIICCLNGHNHLDFHHHQNGIDYVEINSMSYQWLSSNYKSTERFPKEFYDQYGNLPHIGAYKDPLYAFATLDPAGTMKIEGVKSEWMSPSPYDMGMIKGVEGMVYSSKISDYEFTFKNKGR
ncbi:metallophosphoesterase family protein [Maribacter ulvicola]|uniref:Calcineurin-like phosphoesterase n=1 Tax=Maribacter ulvicola TaxID=228959 RepID=A0A1N6ZYB0_9FLAO|nr:metallophosphoesterase [Maribacter ulvicola]SIR31824.1 Calcineurin-like phosphoesterase [Maribacter ulvicola]